MNKLNLEPGDLVVLENGDEYFFGIDEKLNYRFVNLRTGKIHSDCERVSEAVFLLEQGKLGPRSPIVEIKKSK